MKKIVFYFDPAAKKVFTEKINENGEKKTFISSTANFVYTAEIVARVIDIDNEEQIPTRIDPDYTYYNVRKFVPMKTGSGVYYDEANKCFKAAEYGFIVFDGQKLNLLPLTKLNRDKTRAVLNVFPTKFGKIPSHRDISEILHNLNILAGIGEKQLKEQLDKIDPSLQKLTRVVVAQGKEAINGREEFFTPLTNIDKKAGEILSDGRIDFKEVGSIIQVAENQEILQRHPAIKQQDGYDIFGDKITAEMEPPQGYRKGENIVQSGGDENIFVSSLEGCLEIDKKVISVLPIAVIKGNVDYDSGNVDFNGSVHVKGTIMPGFSVHATGDIIVEKNVDDGELHAGGDVTVKAGVVGKGNAKIICGGSVTAKYLLNAKVEAEKEIIIEDSIINCDIFSNEAIHLVAKQGKVIGTKATALYEIRVKVSGSPNDTPTSLNVGRNLYIERELEVVREKIAEHRDIVTEIMRKLKVSFGEGIFENPKEYIGILPPVKKKNALILLKDLGEGNKKLKLLTEEGKVIQDKLKLDKEPSITVMDVCYPGSTITIKKSVKKIDQKMQNVKFYEDPDQKIVRFTSAV